VSNALPDLWSVRGLLEILRTNLLKRREVRRDVGLRVLGDVAFDPSFEIVELLDALGKAGEAYLADVERTVRLYYAAKEYGDFTLELDFRCADKTTNSGVFLRVGDRMNQVASGFEIQILDTHGLAKPGNHDCGGVIGAAAPSKNMAKPAGQWNRYVITLQGKRLKVEMNGEQIHDLELDKSALKDRPAEGHIGFQDEAQPVWYRNVRIKELK